MPPNELSQLFLNRSPIAGVKFRHDDSVEIISGEFIGKRGALISLLSLEPEPNFLLELGFGSDIEVLQSEIKLIDS